MSEIVDSINYLKKKKNAVILAHCYQNIEIDKVADYVGDSLYLSQKAAETDADIIVFAGVYFMAETAKILSPDKKVLLPRPESGCLMADMINVEELKKFKSQYPGVPVVCYVNSTAEIKAESDICCTSANAVKVVQSLPDKKVLFIPDRGLGAYVASQLPDKEIISYYGYCPTHMRITPQEVRELKNKHKDAEVLVHPECHMEVIKEADYVGSTSGIMQKAKQSSAKTFIIATERGVVERLQRDLPEKTFILASKKAVCENMKWNTIEDILTSFENDVHEINVEPEMLQKASKAIKRMLLV
ncbi:MAG: quinolinate synthase [Candidatus Melainabacteria bacterium GWF2_37_15]|nr:MAG: quinolinate synthase [Candidatus Melainabacteria bacterium GWF2_37_15]